MNYADQWKMVSGYIRGVVQAGLLHAQLMAGGSSDSYGAYDRLRQELQALLLALRAFRDGFHDTLPVAAVSAIDGFIAKNDAPVADTTGPRELQQDRVRLALTAMAAFESRMSFLLSDVQEVIRARSERAFAHLQRSIVVDTSLRQRWLDAFEEGEAACEKLGAVHLLLHGIWAFKVDAVGARTDLVLQEPVADVSAPQRYSDGLVLTEWKKTVRKGDVTRLFAKALAQIRLYASGPLAATELKSYRYLVIVSRQQIELPNDIVETGVLYKYINIAVDPPTPSRQ
jgi:hypothetical protein